MLSYCLCPCKLTQLTLAIQFHVTGSQKSGDDTGEEFAVDTGVLQS